MTYTIHGLLLIVGVLFQQSLSSTATTTNTVLVVNSTTPSPMKQSPTEKKPPETNHIATQIYQMHVNSHISNRFSRTTVTSKVKNVATEAQQAVFSLVLPNSAFISGFIMEVKGKNYTAYVKEKEEAKRVYDEAVARGSGAAHVGISARDSNRVTVSVNVQPETKVSFYLTYEELLHRQDSRYEQVINIHTGQPVKDFKIEVLIVESRKITLLKAPPLRSGNEISGDKVELDPRANIKVINDTSAVVTFNPNLERQKELAHVFGTKQENGLAGQFIVQYDVERDPQGGEVLVQDGYFVHFFAPFNLKALLKHTVFILDTSGSMGGTKLEQLKQAMDKILSQLNEQDLIHLVEFNSYSKVWNLSNPEASIEYVQSNRYYNNLKKVSPLENATFPRAAPANAENIKSARQWVNHLKARGATSMCRALEIGLHLIELERNASCKSNATKHQPLIIFLTDGEPTDLSKANITAKITHFNSVHGKVPIFSLSFGNGADKKFLEQLSLHNLGFSKHIYEAADASLQLQDFYRQISSPLLSDVTFKYASSVTSLTRTEFPIYFDGSEMVVAGFCGTTPPTPSVNGTGQHGRVSLKPTVMTSISNIERLWAYLTVSQLLQKKEVSKNHTDELKKQALDLSLKYALVTPVTSLVVVKPNETQTVNTEEAQVNRRTDRARGYSGQHKMSSNYGNTNSMRHAESSPTPSLENLLTRLPWLNSTLNNGFITAPTGTYKLGLNQTRMYDNVICPKTPMNEEGRCKLLHECPQVHSLLLTSTSFFNHFCVLRNEYAGVCCPK